MVADMRTARAARVWTGILAFTAAALAPLAVPAGEPSIEWVVVGDAGNEADASGLGAVPVEYRISRYEVTNAQYAAFLDAVAAEDPHDLYHPDMRIRRTGSEGSYTYEAIDPSLPVTNVSWFDAIRFVNWLHNGRPQGPSDASTTEDGAYPFLAADEVGSRRAGALFFLPSEDEWYKAAYYEGGEVAGYRDYPTLGAGPPVGAVPTGDPDRANIEGAVGEPTPVGSYPGSAGWYGTMDQAGNVWEWTESPREDDRGLRGGAYDAYELLLRAEYRDGDDPDAEYPFAGFRVAAASAGPGDPVRFVRGDANEDGRVDISDAVATLDHLFVDSSRVRCVLAADANDSDRVDISDPVSTLNFLFLGGPAPPAPHGECGVDPTPDELPCEAYDGCTGG